MLRKIFANLSVHDSSITNALIKDNEVQGGKLVERSVALDRVSDAFIANLLDTQLRAVYPMLGGAAMALSQDMDVTADMPAAVSAVAPTYDSTTRVWSDLGAVVRDDAYVGSENLVLVRDGNNDPVRDANNNEIFGRLQEVMGDYRIHFVIKPGTMQEAAASPSGSAFLYIKQWVSGASSMLQDAGRVVVAGSKAVDITETNNIDTLRKVLGVTIDGSGNNSLSFSMTNHLDAITDVKAALIALDAALQAGSGDLQDELDATQAGAGLETDGSYAANGSTNYLGAAVTLKGADEILDARVKQIADNLGVVATAGLSFSGTNYLNAKTDVKAALVELDAQIKSVVDGLAQEILDRAADVDAEQSRAEGAEAGLAQDIADVAADLAQEILDRTADVDAEQARAEGVEADLQAEIDAVETAAGLQSNGTLAAFTGANFISADTSLRAAIVTIDGSLYSEQQARMSADTALSNELDATQTGAGLSTSGAYVADATTNYLGSVVSLKAADKELDARVKQVADNLGVAATAGLSFSSTNYLNAKTDVKAALVELDAQIKAEYDRAVAAEGVLQGNIDAVAADLAQEIIDRAADVDAEQARAEAAEGVLQGNIDAVAADLAQEILDRAADVDAEQSRAEAAEAALDGRLDVIEAKEWRVRRFVATGSETAVAKDAGHPAIPSAAALFVSIDGMNQWPAADGGVWTLQAAGAGIDLNISLIADQTVELKYWA